MVDEKREMWSRKERDANLDEIGALFDEVIDKQEKRIRSEVAFIDRVLAKRSPRTRQQQDLYNLRRDLLSRLSANRLTGQQE